MICSLRMGWKFGAFSSSFGRLGCFVVSTIWVCSKTGLSSTAFASTLRIFGNSGFKTRKTCGCLGFNSGGSSSTGLGLGSIGLGSFGGTLGLTFGGGGGGVAGGTLMCVTGCISSTTSNLSAVCICWGKIMGLRSRRPRKANCPTALRPIRFHRD